MKGQRLNFTQCFRRNPTVHVKSWTGVRLVPPGSEFEDNR